MKPTYLAFSAAAVLAAILPAQAVCQSMDDETLSYCRNNLNGLAESATTSISNGGYDWSYPYKLQSLLYLYQVTGETSVLDSIIEKADAMLRQRTVMANAGYRAKVWADRGPDVTRPYAWVGFTGHALAPMTNLAYLVYKSPELRSNPAYKEAADRYLAAFAEADAYHAPDFVSSGGVAYYRFPQNMPLPKVGGKRNTSLDGQPAPANMNAMFFSAKAYASRALALRNQAGDTVVANKWRNQVSAFIRYLQQDVWQVVPYGKTSYVVWKYSPYYSRSEDLPHSNVVVKFVHDAYKLNFAIERRDMLRLANTFSRLIDEHGLAKANMLDGSTNPDLSRSTYYIRLLGGFSDDLYTKFSNYVAESRPYVFAYVGPYCMMRAEGKAPAAAVVSPRAVPSVQTVQEPTVTNRLEEADPAPSESVDPVDDLSTSPANCLDDGACPENDVPVQRLRY